ncbi:DUF433 domain-containing protein [Duganella radicis]|uniref:DUF433 domain-containing protein n=1 Tax=Duganella radicis TaxID=551988 RepID=A0A6L6PSS2_9BURK|nr:DUF433 domain-containing protein [Duganella radicis]MTV41884.1 DUF433 domain-containing protein [Duganella radicis]
MRNATFITPAEAAYIAELSEHDINRAVDEHIVSQPFVAPGINSPISRLGAAFISFYYNAADVIPVKTRKAALESSIKRIAVAGKLEPALALKLSSKDSVFAPSLAKHIRAATTRSQELNVALRAISVSKDVMWGMPVFRGTRVLVETVVGSLEEGTSLALLKESYAFLTEDLVQAAKIYVQIYPLQRRAVRLAESHPNWHVTSIKTIYPTDNELAPAHRRVSVSKLGQDS